MTHTPGPWRVHSEHADRIIVNGCCVYQVRDMTTEDGYAGNGYGQPSPVDVRLMAAAPELLAALRAATEFIAGHNECMDRTSPHGGDREWYAHCDSVFSDCKAAIAKAEGRTSAQD